MMDRLKEALARDLQKEEAKKAAGPAKAARQASDVYGTPDGRIVVVAKSIKRALERASEVLEENIMNLDYEILEHGTSGFLGIGAKPYKIIAGLAAVSFNEFAMTMSPETGDVGGMHGVLHGMQQAEPADKDGVFKVVVRKAGIFIQSNPPKGKGRKAGFEQAAAALAMRGIANFDRDVVQKTLDEASGEPVKIGEWQPNKQFDSRVTIDLTPDEMKAFAIVSKPEKWGRVLEPEDIMANLDLKGVKFGILEDKIREMLDAEIYNTPVLVAQGKQVEYGVDAVITYNFRTETDKIQLKEEENGRVDFFNLDLVQNVVAGQVLATKTPATLGAAGRTVTNKRIETKPGKDTPFVPGRNCHLEADGLSIVSDIHGQVLLANNKVVVDPVYEVAGNLDMGVGNVTFLGTVVVKGNVEENLEIKAAGNVEILGTVNKAKIEAEGSVIVRQGIIGKDEGVIKAGQDVMAKFVERCRISAGNDVVVVESIVDSQVDAGRRVICLQGKRGTLSGGRTRAREEINVKNLGNENSPTTIVEVGIDPKSREKFDSISEEKRQLNDKVVEAAKNIITLQNQKGSGMLSPEKESMLQDLIVSKAESEARIKEINEELEELKSFMNMLETKGKVSVQKLVYPGARIIIKNATLDVKDNFKFTTFMQEGGIVRATVYEQPKEEGKARPAGKR